MFHSFCFDRAIPDSAVRGTAAQVYSASRDPVTIEDRYEAARHSSKQFWDLALLGGPALLRHGGRAWVAHENGRALKQLLPGLALSAAAIGLLPLSGIVSAIHSRANPKTVASPEAAFVHRLKTAIGAHRRDIGNVRFMTRGQRYGEMGLNDEVAQVVRKHQAHRIRNSNSLDWQLGVWMNLMQAMPEHP